MMNEEKRSQATMIYEKLVKGDKLTCLDMSQSPIYSLYGSRRIKDLKELGVPVTDEWVEVNTKKKVKRYFLTETDIKRIKLNGKKTTKQGNQRTL